MNTSTTSSSEVTALERIHEELLPFDEFDLGAEGVAAWLRPYRSEVCAGDEITFEVELRNPLAVRRDGLRRTRHTEPNGRSGRDSRTSSCRHAGGSTTTFTVSVVGDAERRARIACDVTIGTDRLGMAAEAIVTVVDPAVGVPRRCRWPAKARDGRPSRRI